MKGYLILLLFNIALLASIQIKNFEKVSYQVGTSVFTYQFSKYSNPEGRAAFFYFNFTNQENLKFNVINENNVKTSLTVKPNEWASYCISNLNSQLYTFQIINQGKSSGEMIFIDSTQEINTNLDRFLSLNFSTEIFNDRPLIPLVFNIGKMEDNILLNYKLKSESSNLIKGRDYLMKYSIIDGKESEFKGFNSLNLEKGKKYKLKYDFYTSESEDKFYIPKITSNLYDVKELENCYGEYRQDGTEKIHYFIINSKTYKTIQIHVRYGDIFYSIVNEEKRKYLIIEDLDFTSIPAGNFNYIYAENQYIVLKIVDKINTFYLNYYHIIHYTYSITKKLDSISLNMNKGECAFLYGNYAPEYKYNKYIVSSSDENMAILNSNFYASSNEFTNIVLFNDSSSYTKISIILINSSKEKSTIKGYIYKGSNFNMEVETLYYYNTLYFNFIFNDNITKEFNKYKTDFIFRRFNTYSSELGFNTSYFFNLKEDYYLYIRKHYGNSAIYRYTQPMDSLTDVFQFQKPYFSYENSSNYELIDNALLYLTKYQLFTFIMNYNSLYDIYIQKVNDSEEIVLNPDVFPFNNLVKLFIENKTYTLKFHMDHLVKLDSYFLDAKVSFTNEKGETFILDKNNKKLPLKGDNFKVISDKKALLYFYYKIPNYKGNGVIKFAQYSKGKNMKFTLKNAEGFLIKDFCFEGYYPILSEKTWHKISTNDIYIDNIMDDLEYDLYEGENYIIYIFDSYDENNLPIYKNNEITSIISFNVNLISKKNKYNFEVIPANAYGNIVLNSINKSAIHYQFFTCKNKKNGIKFKFTSSSVKEEETTIYNDNNKKYILNNDDILVNSFESEYEFLFAYTFKNNLEAKRTYVIDKPSIIALDEISRNIIRIKFEIDYFNLEKYYVVIAKKDKYNNKETFSDPCYVAKLMIDNSDSIIVKTIYESIRETYTITDINISKLNIAEKEELVAILISQLLIDDKVYQFSNASEYKLILREAQNTCSGKNYDIDSTEFNYFKFDYKHESNIEQFIVFKIDQIYGFLLAFNEINQTEYTVLKLTNELKIALNKSGTYYFELYLKIDRTATFKYFISGETIDTIDLKKKLYYKSSEDYFHSDLNPPKYIVNNLKKDTYTFFIFALRDTTRYYKTNNPFVICDNKNECTKNITTYKFLKGMSYTIYINLIYISSFYYYPIYFFFPIFDDTIEEKETGYYFFSDPKIFIVNLKNKKEITAMLVNGEVMYSTATNDISLENLNGKDYNNKTFIQTIYNSNGNNYGVIATIPGFNKNQTKIIIVDQYLNKSSSGKYTFYANNNGIIDFLKDRNIPDEEQDIGLFNNIETYISPIKNMKIILPVEQNEEKDFIIFNSDVYPIYVKKFEKDINIAIKKYPGKYAAFGVLNDFLFEKALSKMSQITGFSELRSYEDSKYFNLKFDTNINVINEYFNFYAFDFTKKINFYFKKYYGNAEIYEDTTNYIESKDFYGLSIPMKTSKGKKSLFNSIYSLSNNRSIIGYFADESLFYLYVEIDDGNEDTVINVPNYNSNSYYKNQNVGKYLKTGIEYSLNFTVDHLFKLEPGFDATVTIYDEQNNKIILNPNKRTGEFKGNNVKIKSNNNAMVYLYARLLEGNKYDKYDLFNMQIPLDKNQKGKNIQLDLSDSVDYIIDFGFKGYEPNNVLSKTYTRAKYVFIENLYEKLETELVEGENLYFYSHNRISEPIIKYTENLRHKNNKYHFAVIPANSPYKTFVVNNGKKAELVFQINYCNSPHDVKIYYQDSNYEVENTLTFNSETTKIEKIIQYGSFKLRFESENDFVFSYTYRDLAEQIFTYHDYFKNLRKEGKDLAINITKKYPDDPFSNDFTISFKPNYYNSSTKYIIVIVSSNDENTLKSMSNPCYITKIATERNVKAKIVDVTDIGDNDIINVDADIYEILDSTDEYIVNIISHEFRFDKKVNYYIPTKFTHKGIKPIDVELSQKQDIKLKYIYNLSYKMKSINSMNPEEFLLHYQLKEQSTMNIIIEKQNGQKRTYGISKKEGYIGFSFDKGGLYKIRFDSNSLNGKLNSDNEEIKGSFDIISTEYPFEIDLKENNFVFEEISTDGDEIDSLKFKVSLLEKDYFKKITVENNDFLKLKDIVSISEDYGEYKSLNNGYYLFEKNRNYKLKIKNKKDENNFIFEKFNIYDYSLDNIKNLSLGDYSYSDTDDKFIIIDWAKFKNIEIKVEKDKAKFYKSIINTNQIDNLVKEFKNIKFEELKKLSISKPSKIAYEVLMIELKDNNTLISFKEKSGTSTKTIALLICAGILLLVIIIVVFFIVRRCKRKKSLIEDVNNMQEERILAEIN